MIDLSSSIPKHKQVSEYVKRFINQEELREGDRLPSDKNIAEKLKVSLMTVNKALNALAREGIITRHRGRGTFVVEMKNQAMNLPQVWALATYEVINANITSELRHTELSLGAIYRGILTSVQHLGGAVMPININENDLLTLAARNDISGLIIIAPEESHKLDLLNLTRHNIMFTVVSASWSGLDLPCVDGDNVEGAREAIRYLTTLGHRRLAMVISRLNMTNSKDRCLGFQLESAELELDLGPIINIDEKDQESWDQVYKLLSQPDRPTAIFAGGYDHVIKCLEIARSLKLQVPGDLSLVGFDDVPSAAKIHPPLTMIRQPWVKMARRASEKLISMYFRGHVDYSTELLPMELIVRESCGPPPIQKMK